MIIISGSSNKELAKKIANNLHERPTPCILDKFSDGEIQVDIQNNVRNQDVFIVQSGYSNTKEGYFIFYQDIFDSNYKYLFDTLRKFNMDSNFPKPLSYIHYNKKNKKKGIYKKSLGKD